MTKHQKGVLAAVLAALSFTAYVSMNRYVYTRYQVETLEYTATFLMAGALFAAVSLAWQQTKQRVKLVQRRTLLMALNGLLASMGIGLLVFGQAYTTAINASIIMTATILSTIVFSWFMLGHKLNRTQIGWLIVMFAGLYFAIVGTKLIGFKKGDVILLGAVIMLGFTNNFAKILMRSNGRGFVTDVRLISGGLLFAAIGFIAGGGDFLVTNAGWWPLSAGFVFWLTIHFAYASIHLINPSEALILGNIHPFFTAIVGVVLLSEPYSWVKFFGSVVIILSVYFITKKSSSQKVLRQ